MVQLRFTKRFVSFALVGMTLFAPMAQAAFSDVPGGEFAQYINDLSNKGIMSGTGTNFYPRTNLTRGELAKVLVKAANLTTNTSMGQRFADVPTSNPFYEYISTLAARGNIRGYDDGSFRPNGNVSRGEFSKMVVGAFGFDINTAGGPHFTFDVPTSQTFYPYVETLYGRNVVNGYNGTIEFGVNNPVNREQAAKIVSLGIQSRDGTLAARSAGGATVSRDIPFTYNGGLPRMTVTPNTDGNKVAVQPVNFPYLARGFMYQLWATDSAGVHSVAKFNVRNNNVTDSRGVAMSANINVPVSLAGVTNMAVTIEPANDTNVAASQTKIVTGVAVAGSRSYDLDFPVGMPQATSHAYITKGSAGLNNVLNVDFAQLPDLRPIGWSYEAWYVINGVGQTAGTFVANGEHTFFKSTELPSDLMTAAEVRVSLEPNPDDSDAPSGIVPWSGTASGVVSTVTSTSGPVTTTAQDTELYKGLTTSMTSPSIRARTVIAKGTNVIVQAYAASPVLADGKDQAIVVKVSDANGHPIPDLRLKLSRQAGPAADFNDPQEIGDNSGVYIGTYTTTDSVNTTDHAVVRISLDSGSSSSRTTVREIPPTDVTFDVSSSTRIGSPEALEVDVTRSILTLDQNDTNSRNADLIVLATVMDSSRRTVEGDLGSDLTLSSDSSTITGTVKNNIKYYRLDDRFFDIDTNDTVDSTSRNNLVLQLIPSSSESFAPIVSEQYEVQAHFIHRASSH